MTQEHDEDEDDEDDEDDGFQPLLPVLEELEASHRSADPDAFDDDEIFDRVEHYTALQERGGTDPSERRALDVVVARITFEFVRRLHDEFAPKPGDDDYLEAYDDPRLIERDFEDPCSGPDSRSG